MTLDPASPTLDEYEARLLGHLLVAHEQRRAARDSTAGGATRRRRLRRPARTGAIVAIGGLVAATGAIAATTIDRQVETEFGTVTITPRTNDTCIGIQVNELVHATGCSTAADVAAGRAVLGIGDPGAPKKQIGLAPNGKGTVRLSDGRTVTVIDNVWTSGTSGSTP